MVALVPGSRHGTLGYLHHAVRVLRALTHFSGVPGMGTGPGLTAPAKVREINIAAKANKGKCHTCLTLTHTLTLTLTHL